MNTANGPGGDRQAWLGVLFFVGLGALVLALDPAAAAGWVSLAIGLLSAGALWFVRRRRADGGERWPLSPTGVRRPPVPWPGARPGAAPGIPSDPLPPPVRDPREPLPALDAEGERRVDDIVAALDRAGAWAPRTPDPAVLYPPVAERGTPLTVADVFQALDEVSYYSPDVDPADFTARLAVHQNQVEQDCDYLAVQAADLTRLAGGTVPVEVRDVQQRFVEEPSRAIRTRMDLLVGGEPLVLDYLGVGKYLSTVLHVRLARALREAGAPYRIAWFTEDDVMLVGLPDLDLEALNADLGLPPGDPQGWGGLTWVDECEPEALGEGDAS